MNQEILLGPEDPVWASSHWCEVVERLRSLSGGGSSIATLLIRCQQTVVESGPSGRGSAGSPLCGGSRNGNLGQNNRRLCDVLLAVLWEKLHTGDWRDVELDWRNAYSAACLVAAALLLANGKITPATQFHRNSSNRDGETSLIDILGQAVRQLDLAALMGGPLLRDRVDEAATAIASRLGRLSSSRLHRHKISGQENQKTAMAGSRRPDPDEETTCIKLPAGSIDPGGNRIALYRSPPSLEIFWCDIMAPARPVIIQGSLADWPARERWQDMSYFIDRFGARTVPVEIGRHYLAEGWGTQLVTMEDFLVGQGMAQKERPEKPVVRSAHPLAYLAQHQLFDQLPELAQDIREPLYCVLGKGRVHAVNAWFGPAGTVTPLHQDPSHNLLCQVVGTKYIRLYSPEHTASLAPHTSGMHSNTSTIDLDSPGEHKHELDQLPFWDWELQPGEMLYIPPQWWHYVKSTSTSFSVSFWWD